MTEGDGYLVQLLLPLYADDGARVPESQHRAVRDELAAMFGGVTVYSRAPAVGLWKEEPDARPERDDIVVYEVMTVELDRQWWADYRRTLEAQFEQEEIVIRALRTLRM